MNRRRWLAAAITFAALAAATAVPALGHDPTPGSRLYTADNRALKWQYYASGYPSWLRSAVETTLNVNHQDPLSNNSKSPIFSKPADGTGNGLVRYRAVLASPCSGSLIWLACTLGGGTTSWSITVRDLVNAPYSDWQWHNDTASCSSGDTCFDVERSVIHETLHIQNGSTHSAEACEDTVFTAGQSSHAYDCGRVHEYLACDASSSQLLYGVRDLYGPYGDCFDHIGHHGTYGLKTDLSTASTSISVCQGQVAVVTGRLNIHDYSDYKLVGGNQLAGRKVWFDINGSVKAASSTASASSGNNWSATFSNASYGTKSYLAHFDRSSSSGLDSSPTRTFTITWIPVALC